MTLTEAPTQPSAPAATDMTTTADTDWPALAEWIGELVRPTVADNDRTGEISRLAYEHLRNEGVTAALVPTEFGGGGVTHETMGAVLRTLGRVDAPTALTLSMHSHVLGTQVWRHNHGMDAEKVFRAVVDDRAVLISTGASDWLPSNGSARKVAGGFRVDARKMPISGAEVGDILATSVRWDDSPDGPQVIHCSIPFAADGVSIEKTWDTLGMRATGSQTVVLEDVFVPDAAVSLVRTADAWHPFYGTVLGVALPLIMSPYLGIADAAVEEVRRVVGGRSDEHVVQAVGEMMTAYSRAEDAVAAMFADADNLRFDNTVEFASRTLARKTVACEAAIETVRLALEATGGMGYSRSSILERLFRDVHACMFHPLARTKQNRFTGRVALGLDPVG